MPDTVAELRALPAAERVAAFTALRAGLDSLIDEAKTDALADVVAMRTASWNTPYGRVNMTRRAEGVEYIPDAFLSFVREHYPDEIVTTESVRSSFAMAFIAECVVVAGVVYHKSGGEVDFVRVRPEGDPTISYPASSEQRDAKEYARMLFAENADRLLEGLREVTAS